MHGSPFVLLLAFDDLTFLWRLLLTAAVVYLAIYVRRQLPHAVERQCSKVQHKTIEALATAVNAKDKLTFDHVRRVQIYAAGLGRLAGCSDVELQALHEGSLLHDVGKIGVPDSILTKPGKLTAEEFEQMKLHPSLGADILERVGFGFPIVPVVRHHHERWDGTGYPDGLMGVGIPLTARVLSIVDSFDAVREDRPYRKAMSRSEAVEHILERSGTLYDPQLVGLFLTHLPEFEAKIQAERVYKATDFGVKTTTALIGSAMNARPDAGLATE